MMTATPALPASLSFARIATVFGWNWLMANFAIPASTPGAPATKASPAVVVKSAGVTPLPTITAFLPLSALYSSVLPLSSVPVSTSLIESSFAICAPHVAPSAAVLTWQATIWIGWPSAPSSSAFAYATAALTPIVASGNSESWLT